MPRAATLASTTRRWIRQHRDALAGKEPHLQQLIMLAQSMDTDLADRGRVQGAHSSAYRTLMADLDTHLTGDPAKPTGSRAQQGGEPDLFGPSGAAGGELVG